MAARDLIIPIVILLAAMFVVFLTLPKGKDETPPPSPGPVKPPNPSPGPVKPGPKPNPSPGPSPGPVDPGPVDPGPVEPPPVEKPDPPNIFVPGAPLKAVIARAFNPNALKYSQDCVGSRGVINVDRRGQLVCNKYITGETIQPAQTVSFPQPLVTEAEILTYLKVIYPAYPSPFDAAFIPFYNALEFKYTTEFVRVAPVTDAKFLNTEFIEVHPRLVLFSALNRETWYGTWYDMGSGSGWYIPNKTCFKCYNILHGLNMLDIGDSIVRPALGNRVPSDRSTANTPTAKLDLLNDAGRRLLTQVVLQRGYKCVQISNEWNGATYDRYFVDLLEHVYSVATLVQKNPFEIKTNESNENLWLDVFLKSPLVDDEAYVLDPAPKQVLGERYGDFAFKTGCQKKGGTISIGDMLLNCEKIVKFGLPASRLESETQPALPSTTELDKLQSYFSIVYGSRDVWLTKDLPTLQDYWQRMEMRYKLKIFPTTAYKTYKALSFGIGAPGMIAYQEDGRLAEAVQYVEVVRQNVKNSYYDSSAFFSGCYYYPCRGSGLFIPVGKLFIAKTKQVSAKIWNQPIAYCCNPEDVDIARMAMYKGYQTLMLVRYSGFTNPEAVELVDLRDPITSQMSLIRTHPWDPALQVTVPYKLDDVYGFKPYVDVSVCITTKQYEPGKGLNKCPNWPGFR